MLIGRDIEKEILALALKSEEPEMIAVIGRRRVGKTYLIRSVYGRAIHFELVGIQGGSKVDQLQNFAFSLKQAIGMDKPIVAPKSWLSAFHELIRFLGTHSTKEKRVVFFDELPWLATHRSGFLAGLEYFWNSWASKNHVVIVVCGSAASWMIKKVIHNKGGLHNRVTRRILLYPFTLMETEQYLLSRDIHLDRYQIIQLYMAMGGIPHYLKEIKRGQSAMQAIQEICFERTGILYDEFNKLYVALFESAEMHIAIIKTLAEHRQGLTHSEIAQHKGISSGGRLSAVLEELLQSGFIQSCEPFNHKKKDTLFRLSDEYSLFYLHFMQGAKAVNWQALSQTQSWKSWSGYAFEGLCLKHLDKIRDALKISGIYSTAGSFLHRGKQEDGVQIDLLIDRADQTVNLCEMKFYTSEIELTKRDADELRRKKDVFRTVTKTRKHIFITLISTYGVKQNAQSIGLVDHSLTIEHLF